MSEELKENLKDAKLEDVTLESVSGGAFVTIVSVTCRDCGQVFECRQDEAYVCPACGKVNKW